MPIALVLCVRVQPDDMTEAIKDQFRRVFPETEVAFMYVNPQTPEQLDDMTRNLDGLSFVDFDIPQTGEVKVVALYLQERPLPAVVLAKGETPVVLADPDGTLVRLLQIVPEFGPF